MGRAILSSLYVEGIKQIGPCDENRQAASFEIPAASRPMCIVPNWSPMYIARHGSPVLFGLHGSLMSPTKQHARPLQGSSKKII